jgi:polysaccharide deacetylase family protein (PEP-CTERM system associated)
VVADARQPFLLTFDVEDWDQIVRRRVGDRAWPRGGRAFERQILAVLDLLAELGATATFFVLGMTAERHPDAVAAVAERGHEIASHGYLHKAVYRQTRADFRRDVGMSLECIEQITGERPTGYRAPWFSITRDTEWAYDELAALGIRFDSSQCAWPPYCGRRLPAAERPYRLRLRSGAELWELPVPVWRAGPVPVPVAGGASWRLVPPVVLLRMLRRVRRTTSYPPLYFHPCELDPQPLRSAVPRSAGLMRKFGGLAWCAWAEVGRRRVVSTIRRLAVDTRLMSYRDAFGEIVAGELDPPEADDSRVGQPIRFAS